MAKYTPVQSRTIRTALAEAYRLHASPKVRKALIEAGYTESRWQPLHGGDRDSEGFLQQRPSQGWGSPAQVRDVTYATRQFVKRAIPIAGKYGSAGQLAQAVQRSATPGYFDKVAGIAEGALHRFDDGHSSGGSVAPSGGDVQTQTTFTPGESVTPGDSAFATILIQQLQQQQQRVQPSSGLQDPSFSARSNLHVAGQQPSLSGGGVTAPKMSLSDQLAAVRAIQGGTVPAAPKTTTTVTGGGAAGSSAAPAKSSKTMPKGTAHFEGKLVAAWIKPWLQYGRDHGWKGTVNSGFRSFADQTRIYNSGVRPAARPGHSNHEGDVFPRGAVDVSDAQTLSRILQKARSPLIWAGGKDPVHFSHPHNGGY